MIIGQEHNLNDYPMIDRTLINIKDYKYYIDGELATTVMTSRGCPYKCAFCSKNYTTVRLKSAEKVIEEIKNLHFNFGYKAIMFFDDIFILNGKRVKEICRYLKKLGIIWRCFVRGDLVVKHGINFIRNMADSGCVEVGMGIESGSDTILKIINKGESVNTIRKAIGILKDCNIRVKGFLIVGLPGENSTTIQETHDFLDMVSLDDVDFTIYQPYAGSDIWLNRELYDVQWNDIDYEKMFFKGKPGEYQSITSTSSLISEDIISARDNLEKMHNKLGKYVTG
jgi:radical SAM superfamily enzyme YgiQ (UPF0313 family)